MLRCSPNSCPADMNIFGHCPAHDEFYLVVCNHCSQVVKPQAFQKHCGEPGWWGAPGMAILPPQHPLRYREGQGKAAVLAQPRVGGLTAVGPSAWANARLFPHHPIPPCPGRTPPRPPQQAVCPRHRRRQVPRRHQRAAGSRRDPQCSQGAAGEAPRCPWASPAPARAAGQGQQPLVSARTGTLASSLPQGRSDTPPPNSLPSLFVPVVNLEKIPSIPKPDGHGIKVPPKAVPTNSKEPLGKPATAAVLKEPPVSAGVGGDSAMPADGPGCKPESAPAPGEKDAGASKPPPRSHKKLARESPFPCRRRGGGGRSVPHGTGSRRDIPVPLFRWLGLAAG